MRQVTADAGSHFCRDTIAQTRTSSIIKEKTVRRCWEETLANSRRAREAIASTATAPRMLLGNTWNPRGTAKKKGRCSITAKIQCPKCLTFEVTNLPISCRVIFTLDATANRAMLAWLMTTLLCTLSLVALKPASHFHVLAIRVWIRPLLPTIALLQRKMLAKTQTELQRVQRKGIDLQRGAPMQRGAHNCQCSQGRYVCLLSLYCSYALCRRRCTATDAHAHT